MCIRDSTELDAREISDSGGQVLHSSLLPWFVQLPADVQATALFRQQCVMESRSGFREGLAELAQPGEPFWPFGETYGAVSYTHLLNVARFYAGNARGSDLYAVAAGIEDELQQSPSAPSFLASWAVLTDGVFLRRPREARRVLTALCSDAGLPVLLPALTRRDITPLPQLPELSLIHI